MTGDGPSRTALSAALMRAAHTRRDRPALLDDAWGDRLVSDAEKTTLAQRILERAGDRRAALERLGSPATIIDVVLPRHPTYAGVVIRSRYAEDALADAVGRGVRQYVLIGAGFDSFIVRQPAFAHALTIFEIDHPATQAVKRERLAASGAVVPSNVRFVAADLGAEPLAAVLARGGVDPGVPTFFSWLGVTIYLTRAANEATLRGIATAAAPGSEIVFTYADRWLIDDRSSATVAAMRDSVESIGEPWITGFDPTTLGAELAALGLELTEDLGKAELMARYCAGRTDGLAPGLTGHVARARVPNR